MLNKILKKILHIAKRIRFAPHIDKSKFLPTIRLGTNYGGWNFIDHPDFKNSVIVSCGLGEDASFDVEFARKYNATVVIVDPTPRAVAHFNKIMKSIADGMDILKCSDHEYCLTGIRASQLVLIPKAIWLKEDKIRFYSPPNKKHVSHSIINYQNNYRNDTDCIEVDSITLNSILKNRNVSQLPLLKLDIEGAEIEVLSKMLDDKILPQQILVEIDELNVPSRRAASNFNRINSRLIECGYRLVYSNMIADFLYIID